jgi:ubiquinone/menaquinone biosynthesis C-methylase UbiE
VSASTWTGRTTAKCLWSSVATVSSPKRSSSAITLASTLSSRLDSDLSADPCVGRCVHAKAWKAAGPQRSRLLAGGVGEDGRQHAVGGRAHRLRPMAAPATAEAIRDVNTRYHDAAAEHYDSKWGVDYGDVGRNQVRGKLHKLLGKPLPVFERSLEIGAGTGYFTLNMLQDGVVREATATDISPGMLDALQANAARIGVAVKTVACDAEQLPFADASFDLVLGHAVLHHLPHLDRAFSEFLRVLKPGGQFLFAGEPSRTGDRIAGYPKRAGLRLAPLWRQVVGARPADSGGPPYGDAAWSQRPAELEALDGELLEPFVDVHAFTPDELEAWACDAGFADVRVRGEELLANWFGWINRTLEATARPEDVPWLWRQYAFRGYLLLQRLDVALLEGRLAPAVFYNLMIAGRKPA